LERRKSYGRDLASNLFLIVFVIIIAAAAIKILREYEGHSNSPLGKVNPDVAIETADIILVRSNPLDAVAILGLTRATYQKMIQHLGWATGYNAFAIPLVAGVLYNYKTF
jgi:hypothetical protein